MTCVLFVVMIAVIVKPKLSAVIDKSEKRSHQPANIYTARVVKFNGTGVVLSPVKQTKTNKHTVEADKNTINYKL